MESVKLKTDLTGNVYTHLKYGDYEVIKYAEHRYGEAYYLIRFKNTGYEYIVRASHIKSKNVKDKLYKDSYSLYPHIKKYPSLKMIFQRGNFLWL